MYILFNTETLKAKEVIIPANLTPMEAAIKSVLLEREKREVAKIKKIDNKKNLLLQKIKDNPEISKRELYRKINKLKASDLSIFIDNLIKENKISYKFIQKGNKSIAVFTAL
jgi:hypothetical protein